MRLDSMGECPRGMNLGSIEKELLWIIFMPLRIALDFSRVVFNILAVS